MQFIWQIYPQNVDIYYKLNICLLKYWLVMTILPNIRNTSRALIISKNRILLQKKCHEGIISYCLPGGGQKTGESLVESLVRECLEEIGTEVSISRLAYITERLRNTTQQEADKRHIVEHIFECTVSAHYEAQNGPHPDKHQVDVEWIAIEQAKELSIAPAHLRNYLRAEPPSNSGYCGLVED